MRHAHVVACRHHEDCAAIDGPLACPIALVVTCLFLVVESTDAEVFLTGKKQIRGSSTLEQRLVLAAITASRLTAVSPRSATCSFLGVGSRNEITSNGTQRRRPTCREVRRRQMTGSFIAFTRILNNSTCAWKRSLLCFTPIFDVKIRPSNRLQGGD